MESSVSIGLAFFAGLLTFASPCLLPIVPAYLGYLSGTTVSGSSPARRTVLVHAGLFVLGFSIVLVALGASAGLVGSLAYEHMEFIRRVGGVVVVLLGLHTMGLLRIPLLHRDLRLGMERGLAPGYPASFALGVFFSIGWTPCVGPTLYAILLLAGSTTTAWQGAGLLAVYATGLGAPFLLTALALEPAGKHLRRLNRHGNLVSLVSGTLLVLLGVLLYTNQLQRLSAAFGDWVPFGL